MFEIVRQISDMLLEAGQRLLGQDACVQSAYVECMPKFGCCAIKALDARLNIAMVIGRFTQIQLLGIIW